VEHLQTVVPINDVQAAQHLGVSPHTLRTWRRLGTGPRYLKIGRAVRYQMVDLNSYLAAAGVGKGSPVDADSVIK
jgi:predicted site-specific integrase-resolvase